MLNTLLIFIGCGLGGLCRYWAVSSSAGWFGRNFPYGTLMVNVSGSFLMGLLFVIILERFSEIGPQLRAFLLIGFLGGYTTFSSFSIETVNLLENGQVLQAFFNTFFSVAFCIGTAWLGVIIGRQLL